MRFRRRNYIVNAGLQMKITLLFVAVSLIGSIITTAAFNYFALNRLEGLMWSTHISIKDTGEIIRPLFINVNIINFIFVAVLLIIAVIWMMRKTTGPIFRMLKDIMKVRDGDLTVDIILRQKDEFQDTACELDAMLKRMREKFNNINEKHLHVSETIAELKKDINNPEIAVGKYNLILESIEGLEKELKRFEVERVG